MKPGASAGRMPANVSLAARASVTAGLANDVDDVNQYAAVMYAPTANGTALGRRRTHPQMTDEQAERRHELADELRHPRALVLRREEQRRLLEHDVRHRDAGERARDLREQVAGHLAPRRGPLGSRRRASPAGLKCAPEIGPKVRISATRPAPVASVLASSAIATFPPASCSPMIPEPTTVARSRAVPSPSATSLLNSIRVFFPSCTGLSCAGSAEGAQQAAAVFAVVVHRCGVRLHDEDLPHVAVGVLDPNLVLHRVAARGVLLGERLETRGLEAGPGSGDVLGARDLHTEVAGVDAGARRLLHREVERGLRQVELRVAGATLARAARRRPSRRRRRRRRCSRR